MKLRKFGPPVRMVALVTMLFMLFGMVGPLMQTAGASQTVDPMVALCHDLDTNDNLHLSQGELNALKGAPYNYTDAQIAELTDFCEARPSLAAGKVFVCKYVGTPGVDERLQTGNNPISVSVNAIPNYEGIGSYFADAQGRSYVLAEDTRTGGGQTGEPSADECPVPNVPVVPNGTLEIWKYYCPSVMKVEVNTSIGQDCKLGDAKFTVYLYGDGTNKVIAQASTGADGMVSFSLAPGKYQIVEEGSLTKVDVDIVSNQTATLTFENPKKTHVDKPVDKPVTKPADKPAPAKSVTGLPSTGSGSTNNDDLMIAVAGIAALAVAAYGIRKRSEA